MYLEWLTSIRHIYIYERKQIFILDYQILFYSVHILSSSLCNIHPTGAQLKKYWGYYLGHIQNTKKSVILSCLSFSYPFNFVMSISEQWLMATICLSRVDLLPFHHMMRCQDLRTVWRSIFPLHYQIITIQPLPPYPSPQCDCPCTF